MSYDLRVTKPFERCIKALKKKYPHLKADLEKMFPDLRMNPAIGDAISGFGGKVWKLRVASSDIKKGKRGGYRLIYYWRRKTPTVYLAFTYPKVTTADLTKDEMENILEEIGAEIDDR